MFKKALFPIFAVPFLAGTCLCQTAAAPAFEVASIKPAAMDMTQLAQEVAKTGQMEINFFHDHPLGLADDLGAGAAEGEPGVALDDLLARLEGRSSLGRLGIIVHGTASVFDPGWVGNPTLELGNVGILPVSLYAASLRKSQ